MVKVENNFIKKHYFSYLILSIVVFIVSSFFFNIKILDEIKITSRQKLLARVNTIIAAIDIPNIISLQNNKGKDYFNLRKKLQSLLSFNSDVKMFYLIAKSDDKLTCLADSEIVKTDDSFLQNFSEKAIIELNNVFINKKPSFYGPTKDRLGKWLLVLVPVYSGDKNNIAAVFAMEINYKQLNKMFHIFNIAYFLFVIIFCLLLVTLTYILFYYSKVKNLLKTEMPDCINDEKEKKELTGQLKEAIAQIKILSGCLPICSSCKKIRDGEEGEWVNIETYISKHSEAEFSHGICPECSKLLYPKNDKKL